MRWINCGTWPVGSTRRCWRTRAWPLLWRLKRRRPRWLPRCTPTGSAGTPRRSNPPCTSARWRPCRTGRSTLRRRRRWSGWAKATATSSSRSRTTVSGSIPIGPDTAPDSREWPTGWTRSEERSRSRANRPEERWYADGSPWPDLTSVVGLDTGVDPPGSMDEAAGHPKRRINRLLALGAYVAISLAFFGVHIVPHMDTMVLGNAGDPRDPY